MKRWQVVLLVVAVALAFGVVVVGADSSIPYREVSEDIIVFERPDGAWCVTDYRNGNPYTDCDCPCESGCVVSTPEPTDEPEATPAPTEKPEKTKKPLCNCGGGNGGEDCNPNPNCDVKKNDKQDE